MYIVSKSVRHIRRCSLRVHPCALSVTSLFDNSKFASYEGRFDTDQVIYLLNTDFPDKKLDKRAVANAIQKAKADAARYDGSEAAELFKLLQEKARVDKDWYLKTKLDSQGRLQRISWMNSTQRALYRRYRDVVSQRQYSQY